MTDEKRNQSRQVTETTAPETSLDVLTPEEEKVLRMRNGLSEPDDHALSFALGASEETKARLALMEKYLIELFQYETETTMDASYIDAKSRIIDRLGDKS